MLTSRVRKERSEIVCMETHMIEDIRAFDAKSLLTVGRRDTPLENELIHTFLQKVPLKDLFTYLDSETALVCRTLERIFTSPLGAILISDDKLSPYLVLGLGHHTVLARTLTVTILLLHYKTIHESCHISILLALITRLQDDEINIARMATDLLVMNCKHWNKEGRKDILKSGHNHWYVDSTKGKVDNMT